MGQPQKQVTTESELNDALDDVLAANGIEVDDTLPCLLYTSPSPRD